MNRLLTVTALLLAGAAATAMAQEVDDLMQRLSAADSAQAAIRIVTREFVVEGVPVVLNGAVAVRGVQVDTSTIMRVERRMLNSSRAMRGGIVGALLGGGAGLLSIAYSNVVNEVNCGSTCAVYRIAAGAGSGFLLGFVIRSGHKVEWIPIWERRRS
jgi:hypothetical protein